MSAALTAALILGITGGLTPGPLLTFVISQTLRHGAREGMKVAAVPLLTDSPVIVLSLLMLGFLQRANSILGVVGVIGALYLLYLARETWRAKPPVAVGVSEQPRSILRGIGVNLLNPNPYVFWFTLGTPTLLTAYREGVAPAIAFLALFFALLVGCQMLVALLIARSRSHVIGHWYVVAMRGLAIVLVAFAALRMRDGVALLR